ncbi:MAG: hypothetical protein IJO62_04655 [Clostridia bacterium]|nr:hypothetical protein [Clostridia bacterium]
MKKVFLKSIALLTAALLFVSGSFIISAEPSDTDEVATAQIDGMELMLENDKFELLFNKNDGSAALKNKSTGYIWYTNPSASDEEGGESSAKIKSQLFMYYYSGLILTEMDSHSFGVEMGNELEFKKEDKSVTVKYSLGKEVIVKEMLPEVISKERMEKNVLSKLTEEEQEKLLSRYKLYIRDDLGEETFEAIEFEYPSIKDYDIYIRQNIPPYLLQGLYDCFTKAGYTSEDLQKDCDDNGIINTYDPDPHFEVELVYKLTSDGFSVSVDTEKITYYDTYKPVRICVLPYFGACGAEETGYMLVPDGCGAIIELNNGKTKEDNYWKEFFGADKVYDNDYAEIDSQDSVLPVFAMSNSKAGYLASITSGYEAAGVCADIAGRMNAYNYIYPFFNLYSSELLALTSNSNDKFMLYNEKILASDIQIDYHITDTAKTYSEFAVMYRDILNKDKVLPTGNKIDASVLDVNFFGTTTVSKRFLGIPYKMTETFTTYKQAEKILEKLDGVKVDVNYLSALEGGIKQKSADSIKLESKLGSKKDLAALKKAANSVSVTFSPQSATKLKRGDRIVGLNGGFARDVRYHVITRKANESMFYMVAPSKLEKYADKVLKSVAKLDGVKLNLSDMGYNITSDFNEKCDTDRSEAKAYMQKYLEKFSSEMAITAEKGSYFSLPYLSKITSIPTDISGYGIEDYSVPFYQIVVSGSVDYSVSPLNDTGYFRKHFLKAVEIGARLQYTWYYEKPDDIVNDYENYYCYNYKSTIKQAEKYSKEYSALAKKISGSSIINHTRISGDLAKTEWSNDVTVYVNYSDTPQVIDGVTIEAESFSVVG